ncbi:MAG: AAA family ATPase [Candidatus Lokiarchaeota archaeon]|nr:AAA family ATPase [Candidatus Lokiarchaeota archaeon]
MEEEIKKYLESKKINFRKTGNNQYVFKECIFCGDTKGTHFYMNVFTGLWSCFKCLEKGNFNKFREFYGDSPIELNYKNSKFEKVYRDLELNMANEFASKLDVYPDIKKYLLDERKLKQGTLDHFKIGTNGNKISIPIYDNSQLINIRYRRNPKETTGAKYTQESHCRIKLFNGDIIDSNLKEVYITEGEIDAMLLWQGGYKNVISTTLGASYFSKEWVKKLKNVEKFYIIYDNDKDGQNGAKELIKKLGEDRCINIELPKVANRKKTDIGNYFIDDKHTKKEFELLLQASVKTMTKDILHISDLSPALRKLILEGEIFGNLTGYDNFDEIMGGLREGRLIIVAGLTSTGKSSFANCIGLHFALEKKPVFFFSIEMPPIDLAKKILMLKSQLTNKHFKDIKDPSKELKIVDNTLTEFKTLPIYIYGRSGEVNVDALDRHIKKSIDRHNCKLIIIDHLHYFAHNYNNVTQETASIVRKIKLLGLQYNIPILLLAHLNRGGRSTQRKGLYTPSLSDLRDTGAIEQDADQVVFVCRDSENEDRDERQKAIIKVAKNRDGVAGRNVSMLFNEDIGYFEEIVGVDYSEEEDKKQEELKEEVKIESLPF